MYFTNDSFNISDMRGYDTCSFWRQHRRKINYGSWTSYNASFFGALAIVQAENDKLNGK